jgi:hypothetical protein
MKTISFFILAKKQFRSRGEYGNYQDLHGGQQILSGSHPVKNVKKEKNDSDNPMRKPT